MENQDFSSPMALLLLQLICCAFMTGLIWVIQLVHYPSFLYIHPDQFLQFHQMHGRQITWIVGPVMLLELVTAGALLLYFPWQGLLGLNLLLLLLIWGATAFVSVPIHSALEQGYAAESISKLVSTNWIRTILWSARLILIASILLKIQKGNPS